ncbi:MAG: peptide deformylase [Candidatus Omnitrophota bacterium]|nr:peptide deformylase [Candidatus Omnitrophota bacterium]MBU1928835.1 peptide deformylase [Candidatus Omnitrophota bacterium]MBU2034445.1 peptide deformylase [Candidatus Omnitrophota bacterium]MBU2221279.1 peptide deformylase [Candidatus Omnitrophota bacterium]MBU2258307.1 peptide deformylase [Candidatus Omnitrophota bacterium]
MGATEPLKIRVIGDPVLRRKAKLIDKAGKRHQEVLSKMAQLMYDSSGVGLAAPQVGIDECLIVVDVGTGLYKLINPKIIKKQGSQTREEGCLSVPRTYLKIKRAKKISVQALDQEAKPVNIEAEDLLACALQHEIDHLNGKLIVDYANFLDRLKIKARRRSNGLSKPKKEPRKL